MSNSAEKNNNVNKELEKFSLWEISKELADREKNIASEPQSDRPSRTSPTTNTRSSRRTGIAGFTTSELHDAKKSRQKVIYGVDNRQDYYQLDDQSESKIKKQCDSVVSLFNNDDLVPVQTDSGQQFSLGTSKFGEAYGLCEQEIFFNQPVGAFCSGFLVADDLVATAGHCVNEDDVTNVSFVFGYRMNSENQAQTTISSSEVYRGKELVGRQLTDDGTDWALVRLDRPVENHEPFKIRRNGKIKDQQRVYVIGHPCGLPLKYAAGSRVRNNQEESYFVANLDTYGGNSGSCVLHAGDENDLENGIVEGILVRGETDFDDVNGCKRSNVCPDDKCRGEDCTRTTEFAQLVPE
jgi:V8-like Glu-specific endopeptidase